MMDGRKKKRSRGKKTPLEFEKRLIAGTKRYYMTKLEKLRSNSREKLGITERLLTFSMIYYSTVSYINKYNLNLKLIVA